MVVIAAFDFDGTLTYRDTFIPFLLSCTSTTRFCLHMAQALPQLVLSYATQENYRQACKECLLTQFFRGTSLHSLQRAADHFANTTLKNKIRPEALQCLQWHQGQKHRCVLVSANLEIYLAPWAKTAGFDAVIASQLACNAAGNLTGKLQGLNCRGAEKTRRLQEVFGPKSQYTLYAYGDSAGDAELLTLADFPFYRQFNKGNPL